VYQLSPTFCYNQSHSNFAILYFRRKNKQHSQPGHQLEDEVDKRSGPPVMNDAFRDYNYSIEVERNSDDGDDTVDSDDGVEVEVNNTDHNAGDFYANKESESSETNSSYLIFLIDYL
jgi:hypothetical protein